MAHIPDGFLSPAVIAGTTTISAAALAVAARRSRQQLRDRQAPLLGAATAFVFAAQMLNFPLGAGTSAHLLGGVLVAAVAGPWAAILALFSVLLVQALLFQDGGVAALGANTLNLAVLGGGGGYLLYRAQLMITGVGPQRRVAAAAVAACGAALLTGLAVALQLALSGMLPMRTALLAVGGAHVPVALAEAALTAGILAAIMRSRPDLLSANAPAPSRRRRTAEIVTVASLVAMVAAGWGSALPDALESATAGLGTGEAVAGPLAGYTAPHGGPWVAAAVGVIVVFGLGWAVFRLGGRSGRAA